MTLKRIFAALVLVWVLGFLWFTVSLPNPAGEEKTDAVIVPTGGAGRIAQGLAVLEQGFAEKMLVSCHTGPKFAFFGTVMEIGKAFTVKEHFE